ncbi:MAG: FAD-binding oxidoreductase [Candidatus Paceibacterota bacterium]
MTQNRSPWIQQLNRTRPVVPVTRDLDTDVVIVGGGIAGITTAFFTLRNTDASVVLVEADKVAHGATGHNAGQVTTYFERPLSELVQEFGLDLAVDAQRAVESGWGLLDQIITEARLTTPLYRFTGYAGLSTYEQVLQHLQDNAYRTQGGMPAETMLVAEEWREQAALPTEHRALYATAPQSEILSKLETDNTDYIALLAYQKGCTNSALFSEELLAYLVATYPGRFSLYEGSPVRTVALAASAAELKVHEHTLRAAHVVLCTNGFENFSITNEGGVEIDTSFHHMVTGRVGYMSGYLEADHHAPIAVSYFSKHHAPSNDPTGESYYYLTRRPHDPGDGKAYNLLCTGGPDRLLPEGTPYSRHDTCSEEMREAIDTFLRANYHQHPQGNVSYDYCWHGLMGYTPNGIRRIGPEPCNPVLLYNLGCNGVGILPSVYGGERIARWLRGETPPPSIFDPEDQRAQ